MKNTRFSTPPKGTKKKSVQDDHEEEDSFEEEDEEEEGDDDDDDDDKEEGLDSNIYDAFGSPNQFKPFNTTPGRKQAPNSVDRKKAPDLSSILSPLMERMTPVDHKKVPDSPSFLASLMGRMTLDDHLIFVGNGSRKYPYVHFANFNKEKGSNRDFNIYLDDGMNDKERRMKHRVVVMNRQSDPQDAELGLWKVFIAKELNLPHHLLQFRDHSLLVKGPANEFVMREEDLFAKQCVDKEVQKAQENLLRSSKRMFNYWFIIMPDSSMDFQNLIFSEDYTNVKGEMSLVKIPKDDPRNVLRRTQYAAVITWKIALKDGGRKLEKDRKVASLAAQLSDDDLDDNEAREKQNDKSWF
ncbi:hypothetical protein FisN_30Hu062 [Fistulifera solaris]|uniref:Uncharacterized protein n=1 Tax=Fistulifera solaris TaxID=1519565 RepID=A0A1Z5K6Y9_FISSO|nr:hypothetical protein FisN_30Hu062 [Fistulifera solaris]|eukprot:GAX21861.1 hypothetical protein FisN_30Hu062 [Fistulifera solaris]